MKPMCEVCGVTEALYSGEKDECDNTGERICTEYA